jgi:hypothetical protein
MSFRSVYLLILSDQSLTAQHGLLHVTQIVRKDCDKLLQWWVGFIPSLAELMCQARR